MLSALNGTPLNGPSMNHDAFTILGDADSGDFLITCEHATAIVPPPLNASAEDVRWLQTHWGYDIGAAEISRALHENTGSTAILSQFSRLVCDPNRGDDHPHWIRTEVEGHPLSFNVSLDEDERARRKRLYHDPYHQAIDDLLTRRLKQGGGDVLLFSVHTFTPVLGVDVRAMETGVLFDDYEPVARRFARELEAEGFSTALNEPYSGRTGLIYSAQRHGRNHNVIYLELEVRQDLVGTPKAARAVGARVAAALGRLNVRRSPR